MCGGVVLLGPTAVPREIQAHPSNELPSPDPASPHPLVWQTHIPNGMVSNLFRWDNPAGGTTKLDLETYRSVLQKNGVTNCFDV